jgi:hypothetical protein
LRARAGDFAQFNGSFDESASVSTLSYLDGKGDGSVSTKSTNVSMKMSELQMEQLKPMLSRTRKSSIHEVDQ